MRNVSKLLTHKAFYKHATENEPVFVRPTERPYRAIYRFGEVEKELFSVERLFVLGVMNDPETDLAKIFFSMATSRGVV